jgi:hypothetical protein
MSNTPPEGTGPGCTLGKPEGLSPVGERAWAVIVAFLKKRKMTYTGGCTAFYSPAKWKEREEQYGLDGVLIVVHDGGNHKAAFSMDACYGGGSYEPMESMQRELEAAGFYYEECTGWYGAVYATAQCPTCGRCA